MRLVPDNQGFTLVEVMVSTVVGVIITLAVLQINQYLARTTAIQSGNASFVSLMSDISLRLSDSKNLAYSGNAALAQTSVCSRTLGTISSPIVLSGPTPAASFAITLYDANSGSSGNIFLQNVSDNSQGYENLVVRSIYFVPMGSPSLNNAGTNSSYSLPGEITVTAVRRADLNIAPRPTPILSGNVPLNIIYNSNTSPSPLTMTDCGRLTNNSTQPVTPPDCAPATSTTTGYYLTQDPTTGVWKCNPI